jgi:hypothetical protein
MGAQSLRERAPGAVLNEMRKKMTVGGAKGYGINTTHVIHVTVGSYRPQSLRENAEVPRLPEQKRVQISWLFVGGNIEMWMMVLCTWFHPKPLLVSP